jgi:hypothetical protein
MTRIGSEEFIFASTLQPITRGDASLRGRRELTQKNGKQNYRTLSFLSWAEKIHLPTKHTKRRENFKEEDRLVHVPSTRSGVWHKRLYNAIRL